MLEVWIVVDGEMNATGELIAASPATATMVEALRKAIAQTPDLFTCHWCCLTNQPIIDLTILNVARGLPWRAQLNGEMNCDQRSSD
ncbi:MAG: hypothetical protein U7127_03345 [Phormidium sp.]